MMRIHLEYFGMAGMQALPLSTIHNSHMVRGCVNGALLIWVSIQAVQSEVLTTSCIVSASTQCLACKGDSHSQVMQRIFHH